MAIETTCKRCGTGFVADHDVIMAAASRWRLCPSCCETDEAAAEQLLANERAAKRARPRDWQGASRTMRARKAG